MNKELYAKAIEEINPDNLEKSTPRKSGKQLSKKGLRRARRRAVNLKPKKEKRLPMTKEGYKEYLQSEHWQNMREAMLAIQPQCQLCKSTTHLDVHHMTYQNLGHEKASDLLVLCRQCHYWVHSSYESLKIKFKNEGYSRPSLHVFTEAILSANMRHLPKAVQDGQSDGWVLVS